MPGAQCFRSQNHGPTENANTAAILRSYRLGRQKSVVENDDAKHCRERGRSDRRGARHRSWADGGRWRHGGGGRTAWCRKDACGKVDRKLAVKLAAGRSSLSTRSSSMAAAASPGVAVYGAVATTRAWVLRLSSPPPRTRSVTRR